MTALSFPRETSLHRNRDASLLSAIPSLRSLRISFPAPSSKLDIIAKRQVVTCLFCLSVGFSSFPKSSAFLRERSGRSAFREHSRQSPFQGIFLFYQQLLPKTASFPLVSSLFCLLRRFSQKTLFAGKPRLSLHFKDDRESAALFSPAPANKTLSARRTANLKK